jgi:hypothetical protein
LEIDLGLPARHNARMAGPAPLAELPWALQFADIPDTLARRPDLRAAMRALLAEHEIPVKVSEGGDRRARRKAILDALFAGDTTFEAAVADAEHRLSRDDSPHKVNNAVFARGWARRLIHTHTNVYYCWAVVDALLAAGEARCFVPHSTAESADSACSRQLAGKDHDAKVMRQRIIQAYVDKRVMRVALVPNHPHCTHVLAPIAFAAK